jgi:hypothetical protein
LVENACQRRNAGPCGMTNKKGKGNGRAEAGSFAALRNDNQKSKCNGKRRSRFPSGMTERKATATVVGTVVVILL